MRSALCRRALALLVRRFLPGAPVHAGPFNSALILLADAAVGNTVNAEPEGDRVVRLPGERVLSGAGNVWGRN